MTPKKFLQVGGVILVLLGVVGFLVPNIGDGLIIFTSAENWTHLILGVVAIVLAPLPLGALKKWIVVLVGLLALYFAVAGFMVRDVLPMNYYGVANLENPVDNIIHLVVGIWALLAAFSRD